MKDLQNQLSALKSERKSEQDGFHGEINKVREENAQLQEKHSDTLRMLEFERSEKTKIQAEKDQRLQVNLVENSGPYIDLKVVREKFELLEPSETIQMPDLIDNWNSLDEGTREKCAQLLKAGVANGQFPDVKLIESDGQEYFTKLTD
jgi:hypothetical protein